MTSTDDTHAPAAAMDEQLLLRLLSQVQQLNERVQRLEEANSVALDSDPAMASQQDLLEVRLHSARVAAELSRVTVELRAEIAAAVHDQPAEEQPEEPPTLDTGRGADVIDLTANHPSGRQRSSGWVPEPVPHNRRHTDPK